MSMAIFLRLRQSTLQRLWTTIVNERISITVIETWRIGKTCDADKPKLYIPSQLLECFVKLPRGWWRGPENNKCFNKGFLKFVWLWCEKTQGRQDSWLGDSWYQIGTLLLIGCVVFGKFHPLTWPQFHHPHRDHLVERLMIQWVNPGWLPDKHTWYIDIINFIIMELNEWGVGAG